MCGKTNGREFICAEIPVCVTLVSSVPDEATSLLPVTLLLIAFSVIQPVAASEGRFA